METTCVSCGARLPDGATFCSSCGTKQPAQQHSPPTQQQVASSKNCVSCGAPLPPGSAFCSSCGTRQPPSQPLGPSYQPPVAASPTVAPQYGAPAYAPPYATSPYYDPRREEAKKYGTYGLICGILGLFIFGIILGPLALYFGYKAKSLDKSQGTGGIILGIIDILLWVVVIVFLVILPIIFWGIYW